MKEIAYDKCISCGEDSNEPEDRHIDLRYNYVEGAGQLCSKCYDRIYGKASTYN